MCHFIYYKKIGFAYTEIKTLIYTKDSKIKCINSNPLVPRIQIPAEASVYDALCADQTSWRFLQELWSGKLNLSHICQLKFLLIMYFGMYFPNFYSIWYLGIWHHSLVVPMIYNKRKHLSNDAVFDFENAMIICAR